MAIARVLRRRSCAALTVLGRAANSRESSACRAAEEAAANVSRPRVTTLNLSLDLPGVLCSAHGSRA